jgi:hypothetical protein
MTTATAEPHPRSQPRALAIEQIYITHCLYGEGKFPQAGFNIRAASTDDSLLLRFALEYPHYELPFRADKGTESPSTPVRLALVRIPGGKHALIHSVYLPGGSSGRPNNFFTHLAVFAGLSARDALATWGSPDWVVDCERTTPTSLPLLAQLPTPGPIDDQAVTRFLQGDLSSDTEDLASLILPARLVGEPERCRELVLRTVRGCQLALTAGPVDSRRRFFILAEPGLTALMLYAAARFLPAAVAARLTFSTYEPPRGGQLRSFEHAQVVGSYGEGPNWLPLDLLAGRGYFLDTFRHQCSPELRDGKENELEQWVDLAVRANWETVDKAHRVLGDKNAAVVSFPDAVQAAVLSSRLESGDIAAEQLVALKHKPWGTAILDKHRGTVWSLVREASLTDVTLREEFVDLLREHLPELERRTAEALSQGVESEWRLRWQLLRFLLRDQPRRIWETLERILPEQPYLPQLRVALLREIHDLGIAGISRRLRLHSLLRNCTPDELDELMRSDLPPEWLVWALCYALVHGTAKASVVRYLHDADRALLRTFWRELQLVKEERHRRKLLEPLFPASEQGIGFLGRLLETRCRIRPRTLQWLVETLGVWRSEWHPFWLRDSHLTSLVELLRRLGPEAQPLWDSLIGQIDRDVLIPGESYQRSLLSELAAARDRPGPALPAATADAVADWVLLREHFQNACGVGKAERQPIIDACNRRGLDPIDMLAGYFKQFVLGQGINPLVLDDFAGFFHTFSLEQDEYQKYSSRLLWWLRIVEACPDEANRAAYQQYYLDQFIPFEFRWMLAEETYHGGKLLPAVFEGLPKPTEPGKAGQVHFGAATSELFRLAGVRSDALAGASLWQLGRLRFSWLLPGIAGGIVTALVGAVFRSSLQKTALVALFLPVVYALADNIALQSLALVLRTLDLRTAKAFHFRSALKKELLIGLGIGVTCAAIFASLALAWRSSAMMVLALGGAIALSMAAAAAMGCALAVWLRRRNWDGRLSAGALVRPAAGIIALVLYLGLAAWLL